MSSFTCITCKVLFASADIQRDHYKTDWHRYNLKRKVADLPSVTAEEFQIRVNAQKAKVLNNKPSPITITKVAEQSETKACPRCTVCSKTFNTQNAYTNHIQSKKHIDAAAKQASNQQQSKPSEEEKMVLDKNAKNLANLSAAQKTGEASRGTEAGAAGGDEDCDMESEEEEWEGDALGLEECLFCSHIASSFDKKMTHMSRSHGFFVPDMEYAVDLEGLMTYLGEKVGEGHVCLWCNEKGRTFYSTQAVQQHMISKGHAKMLFEGDVLLEYADFYDYRSSYPDYNGDTEAGDDDDDEVEVSRLESSDDSYQLVLPSGTSVGHRTLQRYYRQKLRPERPGSRQTGSASHLLAQYKALGWTGATGAEAQKRARDMQCMQRIKWKKYTHLGVKANKLQKHFREQVLY